MEGIEATGIPAFLDEHAPFAGLDRDELRTIASTAMVEFFARGDPILTELGQPAGHVYMVRKGSVELTSGGLTVDLLGEGELFGHPSVLSGHPPSLGARAHEDTICLLLAPDAVARAFGSAAGLGFLVSSLRRRGRVLPSPLPLPVITVESVLHRPALEVSEEETVYSVAQAMTAHEVTAVVVDGMSGPGIVTDRDLRERVIGAGLPGDTPIGDVATRPVRFAEPDDLADDALMEMLDQGLRHLPVRSGGVLMGMLEASDLVVIGRLGPFELKSALDNAPSIESLVELASRIPETTAAAVESGINPAQLGRIVASFTDALTISSLRLASDDLGPAPAPWAWVALGSQARREQGLVTDQDHALVYGEGAAEHDGWYAELASRVVATLEACGIRRCPSGVMSSEAEWRFEFPALAESVERAMNEHEQSSTLFAGMVLDSRHVAGALDVAAGLQSIRRAASQNHRFVVRSAELAVKHAIPIGFFGNLVVRDLGEHEGVLNIKTGGIHPVVELARVFALRVGSVAAGTVERIKDAARSGALDSDHAEGLIEAFEFMMEVRFRHQLERRRIAARPDDLIDPGSLGLLTRSQLKIAFRVVREVQRQVAYEIEPHAR